MISYTDAREQINKINSELKQVEEDSLEYKKSLKLTQQSYESILAKYGAENFERFADTTNDRDRREMLRAVIDSATIEGREITVKIAGNIFKIEYSTLKESKEKMDGEDKEFTPDDYYIYDWKEKYYEKKGGRRTAFDRLRSKELEEIDKKLLHQQSSKAL